VTRLGVARWTAPLVSSFLVFTVLQPFLPGRFGSLMVLLRFMAVPAAVALLVFGWQDRIMFALLATFLVLWQYGAADGFDAYSMQLLLSLLAVLPLFKAGVILRGTAHGRPIFRALLIGGLVLNGITIALVLDALRGGTAAAIVMETVLRDLNEPTFRFAIGNPIEVPALITLATVAAAVALGDDRPRYLSLALALTLAAAVAAQSRIVILLSALIGLRSVPRFGWVGRIGFGALLVAGLLSQSDILATTRESVAARFTGQDYGSTADRLAIFNVLLDQCDYSCLTFGHGISSSMDAMQNAGLTRRTMENVALQLVYEIGVVGIVLVVALMLRAMVVSKRLFRLSPELVVMFAQAVLFLPLTAFTPYVAFCIGAVWSAGEGSPMDEHAPHRPALA
jgi:hypothetical protein